MAISLLQTQDTLFVDLNHDYGLIAVSGSDAQKFLQGQVTCDVTKITPDHSNLGAYCNLKGRIIALFRIFQIFDTYYLQLPKKVLPNTLTQLKKYAQFSKVTLEDASLTWLRLGIIGALPAKHSNTLFKKLPTLQNQIVYDEENNTLILSLPGSFPRFTLITKAQHFNTLLALISANAKPSDFETWKLLDIRAKIPEVWAETVEQLLPHTLNLPALNAVSFNKGCYRGQEIVARMEYRGNPKRRIFHAVVIGTEAPSPGTKLWVLNTPETEGGTVISTSIASKNAIEMLIETSDQYAKDNQLYFSLNNKQYILQFI